MIAEVSKIRRGITDTLAEQLDMQRSLDVDNVLAEFGGVMKKRGHTLTVHDLTYAYHTLSLWIRHEPMTYPVVIAAPCGFGKSTLLEVYIRYMVRMYPDSFGCIVIKDKRMEVAEFVDAINLDNLGGNAILFRKNRFAFGIRGFKYGEITKHEHRAQFSKQMEYPVVVMTKEMWARQSSANNTSQFLSYRLRNGETARRIHLFIDERPNLVSTFEFTPAKISEIIQDVRHIVHHTYGKDTPYYREFRKSVETLRAQLERYRDVAEMRETIAPLDPYFTLPNTIRRDWAQNYEGDDYEALGLLENAMRYGGIVSVSGGKAVLTVSYKLYYEWGHFNAFILDATAAHDPYYQAYEFEILTPTEKHTFDNVTFFVNHDYNLSKMHFRMRDDSFELAAEMVKGCASKSKKTMLATYKENMPRFEALLSDEMVSGSILPKHFDSGRATNDYRDCDCAVFLGWLLKGDNFYPSVASAIYDKTFDIETESRTSGFRYIDPTVDDIRFRDMVTERVQDIHRLRPRSSDGPIRIYIFHRDVKLIDEIVEAFPGAKRQDFRPLKRLTGGDTASDLLVRYLHRMKPGQRTKAKLIREEIGVHRNTFAKAEKEPSVLEAMRENGIRKSGTFYIREEVSA